VRTRWLVVLVTPLACWDPVGPSADRVPTLPQASTAPITLTTVGSYRYLVHWDATPVLCPANSARMFPVKSLQAMDGWYGAQLRAAGARPLCSDANAAEEVYRLAWIPSFDHTAIVRIERRGDDYSLSAVELSGAGGYQPGRPQQLLTVPLSEADWKTWLALVAEARFWQAQTVAADTVFDSTGAHVELMGLDGAQWLLEARRSSDYHAVDRWSPLADGPYGAFRTACSWLLHRSGMVPDTLVAGY